MQTQARRGASNSRHILARQALIAGAIALLIPLAAGGQVARRDFVGPTRSVLTIDGKAVVPRAIEGGVPVADVIVEAVGPDGAAKKHLGAVKYEDIRVDATFADDALLDWVAVSLGDKVVRKSGSITTASFDMKATGERTFMNALVTAFSVPALDAGSRDVGSFGVTIVPEAVVSKAATGGDVRSAMGSKSTPWVTSNFRFEMDGLDGSRVVRIDSFTIRRVVTSDAVGEARDYAKSPGRVIVPNLTITFLESSATAWSAWAEDFIVKGNASDANEKNGAIVFLAPGLKGELGRITLGHCGIMKLGAAESSGPADRGGRLTAQLYCETMAFSQAGGAK